MRRQAGGKAMRAHQSPQGPGLLAPYRHLAVRVIAQAWRDLFAHGGTPSERESARTFLSGSPMLAMWCELADMDAVAVHSRVQTHLATRRVSAAGERLH
jgi:hypothetical protein